MAGFPQGSSTLYTGTLGFVKLSFMRQVFLLATIPVFVLVAMLLKVKARLYYKAVYIQIKEASKKKYKRLISKVIFNIFSTY